MTIGSDLPVPLTSGEIVQPSWPVTNQELFVIVERTFSAIQTPDLYFICAAKLMRSCREVRVVDGVEKVYVYKHIDAFYDIINTANFVWKKIYAPCFSPTNSLDYKHNLPFLSWKFRDALHNGKPISDDHLITYSLKALCQMGEKAVGDLPELMRRTIHREKIQTNIETIEEPSEKEYLEKEFLSEESKSKIILLGDQLPKNNLLKKDAINILIQSDFNTGIDKKFTLVKNAVESNDLYAFIRWTMAEVFSDTQDNKFSIILRLLIAKDELSDSEILRYIDVLIQVGLDINHILLDQQAGHFTTALIIALSFGRLDLAKILISDYHADVHVKASFGLDASSAACFKGTVEFFKFLFEKGVSPTNRVVFGSEAIFSLFSQACTLKNWDLAKFLLKRGGKQPIHFYYNCDGALFSIFGTLIHADQSELIQMAFENATDLPRFFRFNTQDGHEERVTFWKEVDKVEGMESLPLTYSSSPHPILHAAQFKKWEIVQLFIVYGAYQYLSENVRNTLDGIVNENNQEKYLYPWLS